MDKNIIKSIVTTLETVSVSGKDNLSKLLGCISALESLLRKQPEQEERDGG